MATDRTLSTLSDKTTTTIDGRPAVQPYEADTTFTEAAVDLLDERALSLNLTWQAPVAVVTVGGGRPPSFSVVLEASEDQNQWFAFGVPLERGNSATLERGGLFGMVFTDREYSGTRLASVVSPARYVRAKWKVFGRGDADKARVRFGITARST